jgi:hypothetical protein
MHGCATYRLENTKFSLQQVNQDGQITILDWHGLNRSLTAAQRRRHDGVIVS